VLLAIDTRPAALTFDTTTAFATVTFAAADSCDTSGIASPCGHTVRNVGADGATAVTVRDTADTPEDGTPFAPPTPVAWNDKTPPWPNGAVGPPGTPVPERVSTTRNGVSGMNSPAAGAVAADARSGRSTTPANTVSAATTLRMSPRASAKPRRSDSRENTTGPDKTHTPATC
jgi:hypothetical protein